MNWKNDPPGPDFIGHLTNGIFRNMDIRRNHRDMTPEQKKGFITALLVLKNITPSVLRPGLQHRYDDFVQIHKNFMGPGTPAVPNPHRSPLFFPWHRILIRQFELELQAAVGDPSLTLPYWNWSMSGANDPFTDDFMGRDGDPNHDQRVTFGAFALDKGLYAVRIWDNDEEGGDAGVRRNFGAQGLLPSSADLESVSAKTPYWSVPDGWANLLEGMHNEVSSWVGGNMTSAASPNDPIFFLHHCHLDFLWEQWKSRHPAEAPFSFHENASPEMYGTRLVFHLDSEPAPWATDWKVKQVLDSKALGYAYG